MASAVLGFIITLFFLVLSPIVLLGWDDGTVFDYSTYLTRNALLSMKQQGIWGQSEDEVGKKIYCFDDPFVTLIVLPMFSWGVLIGSTFHSAWFLLLAGLVLNASLDEVRNM
jgi:hypothetical protein